jgi:phosphatidylinositol-3-phosphatase
MTSARRWTSLVPAGLVALAASIGLSASTATVNVHAAATPPHIMVIVDENAAHDALLGSPYIVGNTKDAPYINSLIPTYTEATNWFAVEHHSSFDYYDLISGADLAGLSKPVSSTTLTLVDQLAAKNISWKAYMESAPSTCYTGGSVGEYYKGHNPFVSFKSIVNNPSQCANVVPYTQSQMTNDLNQPSPPSFVWVTPNQCDDMHSTCAPTNNLVAQGDSWLNTTIPAVQATTWYQNGGIILLTWDESVDSDTSGVLGTNDSGGHIATLVISAAPHSQYTTDGDHFGTLRGLQNAYGVGCLAASCDSVHGDISGAFNVTAGAIAGTVTDASTNPTPISGATVTCSVCTPTTTSTAVNGTYSLSNAPPGSDSVTFSDTGYVSQTMAVAVTSGTPPTTQNAALVQDGSITGTVTDTSTNPNPISGATVTCSVCTPTTTSTAVNGTYTLSNAPSGSDSVTFSDTGYVSQTVVVAVTAGAPPTTQNAALTPGHQSIFSDNFESGGFSAWTSVSPSGMGVVQSPTAPSPTHAAQGSAINSAAYARETLPSTYASGYERVWFNLASSSTQVFLLQASTVANARVATVYVNKGGVLGLQAADSSFHLSSTSVAANTWHELELRFTTGTAGSADVWLDGIDVIPLSSVNLKTTPVAVMQIGDQTSHTWNVFYDDAAFDTSQIP